MTKWTKEHYEMYIEEQTGYKIDRLYSAGCLIVECLCGQCEGWCFDVPKDNPVLLASFKCMQVRKPWVVPEGVTITFGVSK